MAKKEATDRSASLWQCAFNTIAELETDQGILASSREEIYGCIFGRDSLITALRLLRAYQLRPEPYFLSLVKKILINLGSLQGKNENIESGEQVGKIIHEYRPSGHEHLTTRDEAPWYVYEDNIMRNFDSVDSTPLYLICAYRYYQASEDRTFLMESLPHIQMALIWLSTYSDLNADGLIDFQLHDQRTSGGLKTQNWMDSEESVFHEDAGAVAYPIAPVEVQGYAYLALKLWARYYARENSRFGKKLEQKARHLKKTFTACYVINRKTSPFLAAALDGSGKPLTSVRSSMGHCLWASLLEEQDGQRDCIVEAQFIPSVVSRLMQPDMFELNAGIRTLSTKSRAYDPYSYHNGSIWPHDTSMVIEGFMNFGFTEQANAVRHALLKAYAHFKTPLELFVYDGDYKQYRGPSNQPACQKQAWSAASLLVESATNQEMKNLPV